MKSFSNGAKLNNKGFSLVELVIAVALVAVVGTAVFGFMAVGAKTFSSTSSEVNIQNETQLAFNQMQDIIIDTAVGIDYGYTPNGSAAFIPVSKDSDIPNNCKSKNMIMYNMDKVYEISWVPDYTDITRSKLYYSEYNAVANASNGIDKGSAIETDQLMSEYISDFKADLSRMEEKRIVRLDLVYAKSGKEYSSSHNVTLRNKILSGNSIPSYVIPPTPDEPDRIEGPDSLVLEPGDVFNIKASRLFSVSCNDINKSPSQEMRYYVVSSPDVVLGTGIDSTSGLLEIGKGQVKDFKIQLVTYGASSNKSKYVDIYIMRANTVSINFVSLSAAADDETSDGIANNLAENEEFKLEATIGGTHLDEISILTGSVFNKKSVEWKQVSGAENFTLTDNGDGSCTCKMKDVLNLGDDATLVNNRYLTKAIKVSATSKRSIDANKPYMIGGTKQPVYGTWTGYACKKKGDFNIVFNDGGDYERGQHYPIQVMENGAATFLHSGMVMPNGEVLDLTKYVGLVDMKLIETEYKQDGSKVERQVGDDEIVDTGGEGTHWGFLCPYSYNPNATYTYMVTLHLAEKKGSDPGGNVYMLPREGYTRSDYKFSSNTSTITFDRLMLYYINPDNVSNVFISSDMSSATYYPRSFCDSNLKGASREQRIFITYDYTKQFKDVQNYIKEFRIYKYNENVSTVGEGEEQVSHTYCLYDDSTKYSTNSIADGMQVNKEGYKNKNGVYIHYDWQNHKPEWNWKKDTVQHVRIVPVYQYQSGQEYVLFDSYIDIPLWNIEIQNDSILSGILQLVGLEQPEKTYFPVPSDSNSPVKFPGVTNGIKIWTKPCYGKDYPDTFKYKIESMLNSDGSTRYMLTLYAYNARSTKDEEFAKYVCDEGSSFWTKQE